MWSFWPQPLLVQVKKLAIGDPVTPLKQQQGDSASGSGHGSPSESKTGTKSLALKTVLTPVQTYEPVTNSLPGPLVTTSQTFTRELKHNQIPHTTDLITTSNETISLNRGLGHFGSQAKLPLEAHSKLPLEALPLEAHLQLPLEAHLKLPLKAHSKPDDSGRVTDTRTKNPSCTPKLEEVQSDMRNQLKRKFIENPKGFLQNCREKYDPPIDEAPSPINLYPPIGAQNKLKPGAKLYNTGKYLAKDSARMVLHLGLGPDNGFSPSESLSAAESLGEEIFAPTLGPTYLKNGKGEKYRSLTLKPHSELSERWKRMKSGKPTAPPLDLENLPRFKVAMEIPDTGINWEAEIDTASPACILPCQSLPKNFNIQNLGAVPKNHALSSGTGHNFRTLGLFFAIGSWLKVLHSPIL